MPLWTLGFLVFMLTVASHAELLTVDEAEWIAQQRDMVMTDGEAPPMEAHWLVPPVKPYPFAKGEIRQIRGVNVLTIDGEEMPGWWRATGKTMLPGSPVERGLRKQGVKTFIVDVYLTADAPPPRGEGEIILETAPEVAYNNFRRKMESLLAAVPDAKVIIRCWMNSVGKDFVDMHPDALLAGADGQTDWGSTYRTESHTSRPNMLADWRRYCAEHLYRFIHRVGRSPYAKQVGGFYLAAMNTGEWWYYKGKGDPGWDFSPTRVAAFEAYVKAKYGREPEAIAKAWGRPNDANLLAIPSLEARKQRPLVPNSPSNDYLQLLNLPVTGAAATFAKIIKVATGGRALVGLSIGMGAVIHPVNGTIFAGHLVEDPNVDFFGGPSGYSYRGPGSSPEHRILHTTLAHHGKLWVNEADLRTPMAFDTRSGQVGEPPADTAAMRHVLRREWIRGTVYNYPSYLMDFQWDWFYEPSFQNEVGRLLQLERVVRDQGWSRKSEVAFVTDWDSQLYGNYFANPTREMLAGEFDRLPFIWDFLTLSDLLKNPAKADRYRMIVFLNICALGDKERSAIERLKTRGRTLVWMHNPGVVDLSQRGRPPEQLLSALSGITMKKGHNQGMIAPDPEGFKTLNATTQSGYWQNEGTPKIAQLFREVSLSDTSDGHPMGNRLSPYYCDDTKAVALARDESGKVWMALRHFNEWTSVYTAFCRMEPGLLRELARMAGCHIWSEDEAIFFLADRYIGVHGTREGAVRLRFPAPLDLFDLVEGRSVATKVAEWSLALHPGETRIFHIGNAKEARDSWQNAATAKLEPPASTAEVPEAYLRQHTPKSLTAGGMLPLAGQRGFHLPAFLIAGPFRDAETADSAFKTPPSGWKPWEVAPEHFIRASEHYLHAKEEFSPINQVQWRGVQLPASWISSFRFGVKPGQAHTIAAWLVAPGEPINARLLVAVNGEGRLRAGTQETLVKDGATTVEVNLTKTPTLIMLRLAGEESGWTLKVTSRKPAFPLGERGRATAPAWSSGGELYPLAPGSVMAWFPEPLQGGD